MSKNRSGFIITRDGHVRLWVKKVGWAHDGFYFWVVNGAWKGRWQDSDDLLTNGYWKTTLKNSLWVVGNFRYTPPAMPEFTDAQYNEAIQWMQDYIDKKGI